MNQWLRMFPLVVVSFLCGSCERPDPAPPAEEEVAVPTAEGYIDAAEGVRLFYRIVGEAPDTVIVIHGGPGFSMEYFADDLEPLAQQHTLVFYDQRGAGRSSLVSDSILLDAERFAEDLEAVRRHFGLQHLTLLGHSWGAGVVALYLDRYPEHVGRLLIVGGIPLRQGDLSQAFEDLLVSRESSERLRLQERREVWRANPGDAEACRAFYEVWFLPFYGDISAADRSKGDFCAGPAEALENKVRSVDRFTMASLGEWDWRPAVEAVTAPALIIHGTLDVLPVEGARQWAAGLPDARLLLLEGIGHFPYLERGYPIRRTTHYILWSADS